jgi:hypothetical protein
VTAGHGAPSPVQAFANGGFINGKKDQKASTHLTADE